jgi:type IX secretion system PorP/SprF family membrane protein
MRIVLIFGLSFLNLVAYAQYIPNNGQAYQLASLYNPAFSGIEEFTDLKLSYRYQWSGFGSNAPKFMNLAFNTRLKQPLDLRYNTMRISKPSVIQEQNIPKKKRNILGFVVNVFNSQIGPLKQTGGSLGYAWHIPVSKKIKLAIGASSVIENRKIQLTELSFEKPDPFYQHLLNSASSQLDLNVRAGFLLYTSRFYFGTSYLSIVNQSINASDIAFEEPFYVGSIQTGLVLPIGTTVMVKPSLLGYLQKNNTLTMDYGLKAYFQNKIMTGITYRSNKSGIFMFGINASNFLTVNYSYEISFGDLRQFSDGSHELVLGLRINNFKKMPYYTW